MSFNVTNYKDFIAIISDLIMEETLRNLHLDLKKIVIYEHMHVTECL